MKSGRVPSDLDNRPVITVLLTGVGAPGTPGTIYALRQHRKRSRVRLVGTDIRSEAVGRFWVDAFQRVPPPEEDGYVDAINRLCEKQGVDVILPQTTRETIILSQNLSKLSAPAAVSSKSAIEQSNSKAALMAVFEGLGLPCAQYSGVSSLAELDRSARRLGYPEVPVVVKPAVSFGSRGFRVLSRRSSLTAAQFLSEKPSATESTLEELEKLLGAGEGGKFPELLVMEYLPGTEYSVDAFRGQKAEIALPRSRDKIVNGISFETTLADRSDLSEFTLKAAKRIGLKYAFGFQYKLDADGVPKVLECNPRVQGTMAASMQSGVNIIWMAVDEALGNPQALPKAKFRPVKFQRYWGGVWSLEGRMLGQL